MTDAELADGNERLDELLHAPVLDPAFPKFLFSVVTDGTRDEQWRNHCLQFVPDCMMRLDEDSEDRGLLSSALAAALAERTTVLAGTALLGYLKLFSSLVFLITSSRDKIRPTPFANTFKQWALDYVCQPSP